MIPYIRVPDVHLGPLTLHPFGLLVATGVVLGTFLATRRARQRGLDVDQLNSFITWMLVAGFIGGHVLDSIFYHPHDVLERPWSLLFLWEGLSSFGGFTGATLGVFAWKYFEAVPVKRTFLGSIYKPVRRREPMPVLPFCDIIISVFPVAWIFGRAGCSSVHDHPGAPALPTDWLAVAWPDPQPINRVVTHFELVDGAFPRFDLGLIELMFTVALSLLLALTWGRRLATGSYCVVCALAYAPVRFAMDFLRITDGSSADPRYGGLTPAQWECVALFAVGLALLRHVLAVSKRGEDPMDLMLARVAPPVVEPPLEGDAAA